VTDGRIEPASVGYEDYGAGKPNNGLLRQLIAREHKETAS
jgi:hypothetical protein